jgi:tRNA A22 N-methylase
MNDFWSWMIEHGYAIKSDICYEDKEEIYKYLLIECKDEEFNNQLIFPTKEMLIGYKLKYIYEMGCDDYLKHFNFATLESFIASIDYIIESYEK